MDSQRYQARGSLYQVAVQISSNARALGSVTAAAPLAFVVPQPDTVRLPEA